MEGTYPLPEAQLDRFMFNVVMDYLPEDDEVAVVMKTTAASAEPIQPIFTGQDVLQFHDLVRKVREGLSGHGAETVHGKMPLLSYLSEDEIAAQRQQVAFYASTPSYRPVLELHGMGKVGEELGSLAARGKWDEMPKLITDEMLEAFVIIGSWDDIADKLRAKYDGLLDRVGLYRPFVPGLEDAQWSRLVKAMASESDRGKG